MKRPHVFVATGLYPPDSGGPATHTRMMEEFLPAENMVVSVLPFSAVRHLPKIVRHVAYFLQCVKGAVHADVVFAQDTISVGLPARLAAAVLLKPFIVRVPGDHVWEQGVARFNVQETLDAFPVWPSHPYLFFLRLLQRVALFRAHVLVPSAYLGRIVGKWGVPENRIQLIYNGVSFIEVGACKVEPAMRPLVVVLGRLVAWKKVEQVIDAMAVKGIFHLHIIGDGPERNALERRCVEKGIEDQVRFLGQLPNPEALQWVAAADVFVLNSTYEGFSHTLVEAMRSGVPIIATDIPGNREAAGDTVHYVSPGDNAQELAHALEAVLYGGEATAARVTAAKKRAESFSTTQVAHELARYINTICTS